MARVQPRIVRDPVTADQRGDVWTEGIFLPQRGESPLLFVTDIFTNLFLLGGALTYVGIAYGAYHKGWRERGSVRFPRRLVDLWLMILFAVELGALLLVPSVAVPVAVIGITDNAAALAREFFALRLFGGRIIYTDARRWIVLTALNVAQVVVAFALLFTRYGAHFRPEPPDALAALYFSAVTFITLGYGDYVPCSPLGRAIVLLELGFVVGFLLFKLPVAVAIVRAEPGKPEDPK